MNYLIISLKHGEGKKPMFWRADNAGYTYSPFAAGIYPEAVVKSDPKYYDNGDSTMAVPLTDHAMNSIGFACSYDDKALEEWFIETQKRRG